LEAAKERNSYTLMWILKNGCFQDRVFQLTSVYYIVFFESGLAQHAKIPLYPNKCSNEKCRSM
jgi:hypothetical protein